MIALTFWKWATAEMRDYGIDAYLSDLNVAIDDLGGRASLVGLCQGGWLAAVYASRFPGKVDRLVLSGAPIDPGAAELRITRALATVSPATIEQVLALAGGRVSGSLSLALWSDELSRRIQRGTGSAMRGRRGADRKVRRLERAYSRLARPGKRRGREGASVQDSRKM